MAAAQAMIRRIEEAGTGVADAGAVGDGESDGVLLLISCWLGLWLGFWIGSWAWLMSRFGSLAVIVDGLRMAGVEVHYLMPVMRWLNLLNHRCGRDGHNNASRGLARTSAKKSHTP